jgi:hypothetical protein
MRNVEDFLSEKHELGKATKANYRMAFQALGRHTDHPFSLSREEMTRALAYCLWQDDSGKREG